jgi:stage V sporulation protein SpoVS
MKQYISEHRNDPDSFAAAMAVVMSRRNPANLQRYPLDLVNYGVEVEAILRSKLNENRHSIENDI